MIVRLPSEARRRTRRQTDFEAKLDWQLRMTLTGRWLEFKREYSFAAPRRHRADFAWLGARLLVEVQGGIWMGKGAHSGGSAIERDIEKVHLAVLHGWRLLPVTTDQVRSGEAVELVRKVLESGAPTEGTR